MTAVDLTTAATGFERKIRRRNRIEYAAGGFACLGFVCMGVFTRQNLITHVGDVVMILGVAFALWQLHRRSNPARTPAGGTTETLLAFQRQELARQRDALKAVPVWYLLPFVPGFILLGVGAFQDRATVRHMPLPQNLQLVLFSAMVLALTLTALWLANAWVAERLDRGVERIDAMRRE